MMTSFRKYGFIKIVEKRGMAACAGVEFDARGVEEAHGTEVGRGRMIAGGGWEIAYERGCC